MHCCDIQGDTPQQRYNSYRRCALIQFLFWFIPYWLGTIIIPADTDMTFITVLRVTRFILWGVSIISLCCLFFDQRETSKRWELNFAVITYLIPAGMCLCVSIPTLTQNFTLITADNVTPIWTSLMQIYTYVMAVGLGVVTGAVDMPLILHQVTLESRINGRLLLLTTIIGLGTRISGYIVLTQIWAFVDSLAVIYILMWHILYGLNKYAQFKSWRGLRVACLAMYILIIVVAAIRFSRLDFSVQEMVSEALSIYLQITIESTITLFFVSYFTATLTRLVLLTYFIPDEAHPQEMLELVPV